MIKSFILKYTTLLLVWVSILCGVCSYMSIQVKREDYIYSGTMIANSYLVFMYMADRATGADTYWVTDILQDERLDDDVRNTISQLEKFE